MKSHARRSAPGHLCSCSGHLADEGPADFVLQAHTIRFSCGCTFDLASGRALQLCDR